MLPNSSSQVALSVNIDMRHKRNSWWRLPFDGHHDRSVEASVLKFNEAHVKGSAHAEGTMKSDGSISLTAPSTRVPEPIDTRSSLDLSTPFNTCSNTIVRTFPLISTHQPYLRDNHNPQNVRLSMLRRPSSPPSFHLRLAAQYTSRPGRRTGCPSSSDQGQHLPP